MVKRVDNIKTNLKVTSCTFFVLIIPLVFGEEYNLWSSLSRNFLHSFYDHAKCMFHFRICAVIAVARLVIIEPLTWALQVLSWTNSCDIWYGRNGTLTGSFRSIPLFPYQYHATNTPSSANPRTVLTKQYCFGCLCALDTEVFGRRFGL